MSPLSVSVNINVIIWSLDSSYPKKLSFSEIHRHENLRVLQDNTQLLQEINVLRRELKSARTHTHSLETELGLRKRREKKEDEIDEISPKLVEKEKTIELQMCEIRRLNKELKVDFRLYS